MVLVRSIIEKERTITQEQSYHTLVERRQYFEDHPLIENITLYRFSNADVYHFIPEGKFEIVFQLAGTFYQRFDATQSWQVRPTRFLGGLHSTSYWVKTMEQDQYGVGIQLKSSTAYQFIGERLNAFKNKLVDVGSCFGNLFSRLDLVLSYSGDFDEICTEVVKLVDGCTIDASPLASRVGLDEILHTNGRVEVGKLAQKAFLSDSQYRKVFREHVGLSPSEYCKVIRINQAIEQMKSSPTSLTGVAYNMDYYDQAHFIREFRSVVKMSPSAFLKSL